MRCGEVESRRAAGEFVAIVGPSGSGKSTLFHILGGLTPPTQGAVTIAGTELGSVSEAGRTELRKKTVGFVFQKYICCPRSTARENIEIARDIAGFKGQFGPRIWKRFSSCLASRIAGSQTARYVGRRTAARGHRPRGCQSSGY